jgi:hypothetical protein
LAEFLSGFELDEGEGDEKGEKLQEIVLHKTSESDIAHNLELEKDTLEIEVLNL